MAVVGGVEGKPNQIGIRRSGRNGISGYHRSQTNTKNTHKNGQMLPSTSGKISLISILRNNLFPTLINSQAGDCFL